MLSLGEAYAHRARDRRLERELGVVADDDRERPLLRHFEPARERETVREEPIAHARIDRRVESDELYGLARRNLGEPALDHPAALKTMFAMPPTMNAVGMISASISIATHRPCSFTIIITLAMHGTNSVIVTIPTTVCTGVSA